jgi:hypothetical protein
MNKHIEKFNMDVIEGVISSIKERFRAENKPEDVIDNLKKVPSLLDVARKTQKGIPAQQTTN